MGLHQLPRLEGFIRDRERNADYWNKHLSEENLILPHPRQGVRHAWFCYPIGVRKSAPFTRNQLVEHLNRNGIETRPIMSGTVTRQPFLRGQNYRAPFPLVNSDEVSDNWFFIGNHTGIGEAEREYVANVINSASGTMD
jgi:CDP-6-deoxy-D-xylo-4-hexulose-3-dehydrase